MDMINPFIEVTKVIMRRYPAVVPLLKGNAARFYCEHKAVERDPGEPGYEEKNSYQRKIQRALSARLKRQLEQVSAALDNKGFFVNGVYIEDVPDENSKLVKLIYDAILAGTVIAQEDIGVFLPDGVLNQYALQAAREYVTDWLEKLDSTTQDAIRQAVETFVSKPGTTVGDVISILEPTFGSARAERIAVTETTRVFALGNDIYAKELQAQYPDMEVIRQWWTNNDDRVCPICGPLHGKQAKRGETFDGIANPPAHVNCRCWTSVTVKA